MTEALLGVQIGKGYSGIPFSFVWLKTYLKGSYMFNYLLKLDSGEVIRLSQKASAAKTELKLAINANKHTQFRIRNTLSNKLSEIILQKTYVDKAEYIEEICNVIDVNLHRKEETFIYERLLESLTKTEELTKSALYQSKDFYDDEQRILRSIISELYKVNININSILKIKYEANEVE